MKVISIAASSDEPVTLAPVSAITIDARLNGEVWVFFNYEVGVSGNILKPGDHLEIKDETEVTNDEDDAEPLFPLPQRGLPADQPNQLPWSAT